MKKEIEGFLRIFRWGKWETQGQIEGHPSNFRVRRERKRKNCYVIISLTNSLDEINAWLQSLENKKIRVMVEEVEE